jgi:hypothetical protein
MSIMDSLWESPIEACTASCWSLNLSTAALTPLYLRQTGHESTVGAYITNEAIFDHRVKAA